MSNMVAVQTLLNVCVALLEQDIHDMQVGGAAADVLRGPVSVRNILGELRYTLVDDDRDAAFKRMLAGFNHARHGMGMTSKVIAVDPDDLDDETLRQVDEVRKRRKK